MRAAVSVGKRVSVSVMNGTNASMRDGRGTRSIRAMPGCVNTRSTVL